VPVRRERMVELHNAVQGAPARATGTEVIPTSHSSPASRNFIHMIPDIFHVRTIQLDKNVVSRHGFGVVK